MKKNILTTIALFLFFTSLAQNIKNVAKGTITIYTGQVINFVKLKSVDKEVVFTNIETKAECRYLFSTISKIVDENNEVIYLKSEGLKEKYFANKQNIENSNPIINENKNAATVVLKENKEVKQHKTVNDTLNNTIIATKPINATKILTCYNPSKILLEDKALLIDEVREILKTNSVALLEYNNSRTLKTVGDISLGLGLGLFIGGGISNLSTSKSSTTSNGSYPSNSQTKEGSSTPLIIGLVLAGISIPLKLVAKSNAKTAIDGYNNSPIGANKQNYKMLFVVNQSGVGLAMNF